MKESRCEETITERKGKTTEKHAIHMEGGKEYVNVLNLARRKTMGKRILSCVMVAVMAFSVICITAPEVVSAASKPYMSITRVCSTSKFMLSYWRIATLGQSNDPEICPKSLESALLNICIKNGP